MKRYCLALDLQHDDELVAQYVAHHQAVWPEVLESIRAAGVTGMEIYRLGYRMFMVMDTDDSYTHTRKAAMDAANEVVQRWEGLMGGFQRDVEEPEGKPRWREMECVFSLVEA